MDFVFDTDALSLVLQDLDILKAVQDGLPDDDRLLIPELVVNELFDSKSQRHLTGIADSFLRLARGLAGRLEIALIPKAVWPLEIATPLNSTPVHDSAKRAHILAVVESFLLAEPVAYGAPIRESVGGWKETLEIQANSARHHDRARFKGEFKLSFRDIANGLRQGLPLDPWIPPGIGVSLEQVRDTPERYHSLRAWGKLRQLLALADAVTPDELNQDADFAPMLRVGRNDRYDANIATTAAYADFFVTNDVALRSRCEFLRGERWLHFRSESLEEFLPALR